MRARVPEDETERLQALEDYAILDTAPEPAFDDLTALASALCETPIALFSLIDHDRQWFKAGVGIDVQEMDREVAFCSYTILEEDVLVVEDTHQDPRFAKNPLVLEEPFIRFYAGAPLITSDGFKLGSLCIIDRKPRTLPSAKRELLKGLARQAVAQLEFRRHLQELGGLNRSKDQLLTLISHDLRGPLQGVLGFAHLLRQQLGDEGSAKLLQFTDHILDSAQQVQDMLNRLLELAHFELGDLRYRPEEVVLQTMVEEVFLPFAKATRDKSIRLLHTGSAVVDADPNMLRPVLRNLVSNAIKFSNPGGLVEVEIRPLDDQVEVEVRDEGIGMDPKILETLLEGRVQSSTAGTAGERGVGLGFVLIHKLISRLGATLTGDSEIGSGSKFTLELPRTNGQETRPFEEGCP